jgi:zinc-ribbon domain
MPRTCHRCGHTLLEDASFCPNCGAPQIRVNLPEQAVELSGPATMSARMMPTNQRQIQWPRAFMAVFIPALITAVLVCIHPLFLLTSLIWVAVAGFFSNKLYRRRAPQALIDTRIGAKLGAAVGLLIFVFAGIIVSVEVAVMNASGGSFRQQLLEQMRQAAARNPNPESTRVMEQMAQNPQLLAAAIAVTIALFLVLFLIAGAVGGALGAAAQQRKPRI